MENNIEEGKIISKIDKVFKQIDPNSKKQITELSENAEFRSRIECIKSYVQSYIGKEGFPKEVYDKAKELTDFCSQQYEMLCDKKVELEEQRKKNTELSVILNEAYLFAITREDYSDYAATLNKNGLEEYVAKLDMLKDEDRKSNGYAQCEKSVKSKVTNLNTNLHIDIDLERIEDKVKALTYISIELDNMLAMVQPFDGIIVEIEAVEEKIDKNLIEKYVHDNNTYAEYLDDSLIVVKTGLLHKIANNRVFAKIKEWFGNPNVKALNSGVVNE